MKCTELVKHTVTTLNEDSFETLKKLLINEYIYFSIINDNDVTKDILAEKICDYFEKLFYKMNDNWDKFLKNYFKVIDSKISSRILPTTKSKPNPCRARKYYEHAKKNLKDNQVLPPGQFVGYYRIMFCLYDSIINNDGQIIENFDYTLSKINITSVLLNLSNTTFNGQNKYIKKVKDIFNENELYTRENGILVLSIIILHKFMDNRILGEHFNG
ncbi:TPA: hypothetical protein ACGOOQ_001664 [Streptococcus suis]